MTKRVWYIGLAAVLAVSACKPKDDDGPTGIPGFIADQPALEFDSTEAVEFAVGLGYPTQPVLIGLSIVIIAQLSADQDGCPIVTDNSDATTTDVLIEGNGCTVPGDPANPDDNDTTYNGTITITGDESSSLITYQQFSVTQADDCNGPVDTTQTYDGTVALSSADLTEPGADYDILLQVSVDDVDDVSCDPIAATLAWDMQVNTVNSGADTDMDGEPDEFITFDSTGDVGYSFEGDFAGTPEVPNAGKWAAEAVQLQHSTIDEVGAGPDDCEEPLSGDFSITAGGSTAELVPDGQTACTIDSCAPWSLDGTLQPDEICNIPGCNLARAPRAWSWGAGVLALMALGAIARRRRYT